LQSPTPAAERHFEWVKRRTCRPDLPTSLAMVVATTLLALLYAGALAVPLWLRSVGLLPWHYALGADALVLGLLGVQFAALDGAALRAAGARLVSRREAPKLHDVVERLAALADVPTPRVAVVDSAVPDAFASGRSPAHSTVVVTRGLVATLEPSEIEAVLAHELSHVANRDGAVMTFASFPALTLREALSKAPLRVWFALLPLMALAGIVLGLSTLLMLTVSRCREYAADRGAALLTGAPEQLMSALQKIAGGMSGIPDDDLRSIAAMSAFFIVPTRLRSLSHPPLERRLARLAGISRELGRADPPRSHELDAPTSDLVARLVLGAATFVVVLSAVVLVGTLVR
jgi:heat shock protein HtpX